MKTKICPYCSSSFADAHGNAVYCPDKDCGYEAKKIRSRRQNATINLKANPFWWNEKILRETYNRYPPQTEISPTQLETAGFDFDLDWQEKEIDGAKIYCMINFGYSFLQNKNIIVWKLK
jgi:ribosomal protein S27AE